jgi:outer membrane protein OmpA-like peptidoglycan-associated protein
MKRLASLLPVLLLCVPAHVFSSEALVFRHLHRPGEQYRIIGVNKQEIFVDGEAVGSAELLTRIQIAKGPQREITARYQISEENTLVDRAFALEREHRVTFTQNEMGVMQVPRRSFVPQVRNIPVFPEQAISPGATWTYPAEEVYDFREGLNIPEPLMIPVDVQYVYHGPAPNEGPDLHHFEITYNLLHRPGRGTPEAESIRLITARFRQQLYWDARAGRPDNYQEEYALFFQLTDGARLEYRGSANGRVVDAPPLDRSVMRQEIEDSIALDNLPDARVRSDEDGVTIALEDIRFAPDSADLLPSEDEKLEWLAQILMRFPNRDILITGHTAMAGSEEGRQRLSEERAAAVGEYLISRGVRPRDAVLYRGMGAREPVDTNETDEGRRRNRRVEITIREN